MFFFFVFINDIAYWFAIATAYPEIFSGDELVHYIKVRVPVALLGALFDSLSLHIALLVVRQALLSQSNLSYLSHLSIDVLIAIAATFWVLFIFSVSGWIVSFMPSASETIVKNIAPISKKQIGDKQTKAKPESLADRNKVYTNRAVAAINNPTGDEERKDIYYLLWNSHGIFRDNPNFCAHFLCSIFLTFFLTMDKKNMGS